MYVLEILFGGVIGVPLIKGIRWDCTTVIMNASSSCFRNRLFFFFGCFMCWQYLNLTALCVLKVMQLKSPTTFYSMTP